MMSVSEALDFYFNLSILEGVRRGNDFRFPSFRFFLTLSIMEGVRQGDDSKASEFKIISLSNSFQYI